MSRSSLPRLLPAVRHAVPVPFHCLFTSFVDPHCGHPSCERILGTESTSTRRCHTPRNPSLYRLNRSSPTAVFRRISTRRIGLLDMDTPRRQASDMPRFALFAQHPLQSRHPPYPISSAPPTDLPRCRPTCSSQTAVTIRLSSGCVSPLDMAERRGSKQAIRCGQGGCPCSSLPGLIPASHRAVRFPQQFSLASIGILHHRHANYGRSHHFFTKLNVSFHYVPTASMRVLPGFCVVYRTGPTTDPSALTSPPWVAAQGGSVPTFRHNTFWDLSLYRSNRSSPTAVTRRLSTRRVGPLDMDISRRKANGHALVLSGATFTTYPPDLQKSCSSTLNPSAMRSVVVQSAGRRR